VAEPEPAVLRPTASTLTREWGVHTLASLNPIMVDGTGMCGGCRVTVGGKVKFACVGGLHLEEQYQISFWDALIVQAAEASGAVVLYSEDLSDGQTYRGVRVVNPLRPAE
jgi:hypothetical protein